MPGAGRPESVTIRAAGVTVALVAIVGYLFSGWSFNSAITTAPAAMSILVAVLAIGWTLYSRVFPDKG